MAKRSLDEAATTALGLQEPKKQKLKHSHSNGTERPSNELTKAERKELKKLKKQKERKDPDQETTITADIPKATTDIENSGLSEAQKAAEKAARKAEKKRLKALKSGVSEESIRSDFHNPPTNGSEIVSPKKLSKAERKAEKAKKKASEAVDAPESSGFEIPATDSHTRTLKSEDELISKAERKAEKKRLKAERKAGEANGVSKNEQNGVDGHGASNTISNGQRNGVTNGIKQNHLEHVTLSQTPQAEVDKFLASNFISIQDPTTATLLRPIMSFSQLPSDTHLQPSPFAKFKSPTPIQAASWPFLLEGRDVVGVAETGSGKTLAFGVPCIRHISALPKTTKGGPARAVIVSPTRELAVQIYEQIVTIATPAGLRAVCVYGGVPKEAQRAELKNAHIVVATPGRLNDLVEEGSANLSSVSYMVLDEADRMLDKGFEDAIRKIASSTGPAATRQTLMFTATWPPSVRDLAATFMKKPVKISIGDNPTGELRANTKIKQTVEVVDPRGKEPRLIQLLKQYQSGAARNDRVLVFCLYKKEATRVENFLRSKGLRVAGIHGDLSQEKRAASLDSFKEGKTPLLVATDVAARGLDIPDVKLVINVTFPLTAEDYVHRIGRTGRAGAEGHAITLFTEHDKTHSGALINVLRAAGQPVPDELLKFGTTVKKKTHDAYGAFYKDNTDGKEATKIKFDD